MSLIQLTFSSGDVFDKLRFTDIGKTAAAREIQSRWLSGFVSARYSKKAKTE